MSSQVVYAVRTVGGKPVAKEGKRGTGKRLRYYCGFCRVWFVSRQQKNDHTSSCNEGRRSKGSR